MSRRSASPRSSWSRFQRRSSGSGRQPKSPCSSVSRMSPSLCPTLIAFTCSNMARSPGRATRAASRPKPGRNICNPSQRLRQGDLLAAALVDENDDHAAACNQSNPGKRKGVRQSAEDENPRQHSPEREAVEEGRDSGCPAEALGEQEPNMPERDEQAGETEKGEVPVAWRLPGLETERHGRRRHHHHDIARERHNHYWNARRHVTPNQIARRNQQSRREGEQSGRGDSW